MSVDLVIGIVGFVATVLVVAGMILLAPRGTESADNASELAPVTELRDADVA